MIPAALFGLAPAATSLAGGLALEASPARLAIGRDPSAVLTVRGAPGPPRDFQLACSSGEVRKPKSAGPGTFRAEFVPPRSRDVSWVVCAAVAGGTAVATSIELRRWEMLALGGLPPLARVEVLLGRDRFGPVRADAKGAAEIGVMLTPRAREAEIIATPSGKPPILRPHPIAFAPGDAVLLVAASPSVTADGARSVAVWAFAQDEKGAGEDVPLTFSAPQATLSMRRVGPNAQQGTLVPWPRGAPGECVVAARPRAGKPATLPIKLLAGVQPRVALEAPLRELPADGLASTEITIRVADASGRALARMPVRLAAKSGVVGKLVDRGDGSYVAPYTVPSGAAGETTVAAELEGAVPATLAIALTAPQRITVKASLTEAPADGAARVALRVAARGPDGRPLADGTPIEFATPWGTIPSAVPSAGGRVDVEFVAGTRAGDALVEVRALGAKTAVPIALLAGPPAKLTVSPERSQVICDGKDSLAVRLSVRDGFDNPLDRVKFQLAAREPSARRAGRFDAVAPVRRGEYVVRYHAPECRGPASAALTVAAGPVRAEATISLTAVPARGGLSIRAVAHTNLGRLFAPAVEIEGDARLAFVTPALHAAASVGLLAPMWEPLVASGRTADAGDFTVTARPLVVSAHLGPRWHLLDGPRTYAWAGVGVDAHLVQIAYQVSLADSPAVQTAAVLGAHARAGGGLSLGPGIALVEARYLFARLPAGSAFEGQIGGLEGSVGYRLPF